MTTIRFQRMAWLYRDGKPSKVHYARDGIPLCSARQGKYAKAIDPADARSECFDCIKRGRHLQNRNVYTGKPTVPDLPRGH